jgi:hypothetical protein
LLLSVRGERATANLKVIDARRPSRLERLADDYLATCRAAGASPKTVRFGYGFPIKDKFVPWAAEQVIVDSAEVDNRVLDRFAVHFQEVGGSGGVSASTRSGPI